MAGISSKAAGKLVNKSKYNGIEHNSDFDLNMYDAFYRNLDPQIGRFWQIDPESESLEEYSAYASMYNNPISNIDPLGDFATRVGAWLYKVFIGGGTIGQNSYGEWYVQKSIESDDGSAGISLTYGKGRSATTAYREKLLSQYESLEQEERMAQLGIYDPSLTMSQARQNFAGISSGVVIPNITVKPITITINTPKPVKAILPFAKGVLEKFTKHAFAGARHADLGLSVEKMAANGMKLIEQNASLLKAGDNTLVGTINGVSKSFKAFVKDGEIISVNMYPGVSNRITQGPVINFGNVIW